MIGSALLHTVTLHTSTGKIYGYSVILGFGAGLFLQAPFAIAQAKVKASDVQDVSSFITTGQVSGIVFSLAICNDIFINLSTQKISALLPNVPIGQVQSVIAGVGASFYDDLSAVEKESVLSILVDNISSIYIVLIVGGALVTLLSLFMKRERMDSQVLDTVQ